MTTTYTITTTTDNETYYNCSSEMLKRLRKTYGAKNVKAVKNVAEITKSSYYRGELVTVIEERQLGWSLVYSGNTAEGNYKQFFANTSELEYR